MCVCYECYVLSGTGLCAGLITRPEESYRLWCDVVCDLETSWLRKTFPVGGAVAPKDKKNNEIYAAEQYKREFDAVCPWQHFYIPVFSLQNLFYQNNSTDGHINLLGPELFFLILAHPVYKMWIIQEPNMVELWNKLHFEEEKNGDFTPCLKYSVPIFVE